jgi:CO/xanthine dehydrogenase Mo-binding subunit
VLCEARCVYTNRTPGTAMRGFGVTASDFSLEVQMDKLARLVGMDPMEFRILNAYRDGDMKAHHKRTEGAALIECVQAAAELANWPIGEQYKAMSSRQGGGWSPSDQPVSRPAAQPAAAQAPASSRYANIFGGRS